jgi:predicted unusual protein kinase regulating ubiquinone biosynthesis (AarF/ABC1/UbiB family)
LGRLVSLSGKLGGSIVARTASRMAGGDGSWAERRAAKELVATLGRMKGVAQKLGQVISMDMDRLPPEVREIISALQGKAEPLDFRAISKVVEAELGAPPEEIFARFEERPFAAASLGQVHRARLRSGREVAVKVQYPGVVEAMTADLANLETLVKTMGTLVGSPMKGRGYYDELHGELRRETDYRLEAENAGHFREWLQPFPEIVVPEVIADHSSLRVLTLEYLEGEPLSELLKRGRAVPNEQRFAVSAQLMIALFAPVLMRGAVHADPHPGNFQILPDGRMGLLDFGAVKYLSSGVAAANLTLYRSILAGEPPDPVALLGTAGFEIGGSHAELRAIWRPLFFLLARPALSEDYDYGTSTLVTEAQAFARQNLRNLFKVRPPAEGMMFFRAVGGHAQNLRALGARGNFRGVYAGVLQRAMGEAASAA